MRVDRKTTTAMRVGITERQLIEMVMERVAPELRVPPESVRFECIFDPRSGGVIVIERFSIEWEK